MIVTKPVLQGLSVIQWEDSVPAGSMSLDGSAQNVPLDTLDFPTADVSTYLLMSESFLPENTHTLNLVSFLQHVNVAADCVMR